MGLHVVVFTNPTPSTKQSLLVQKLLHLGACVDAVHGTKEGYLTSNYTNARFFFLSDFLSMCAPEELHMVQPDFVVAFNEDESISEKDWVCMERYLESLFVPSIQVSSDILETGKALLQQYYTPAPLVTPPENNAPELTQHYELYMKHIPERDTMLIQVEKPFCDLPYTVVIENYNRKGLKSFFTDLFIAQSWGVARKDYEFLTQVWEHWNMEGEYNLDQMLREATQQCFPDKNEQPEPEPIVYRRPIENVVKTLAAKDLGHERRVEDDFWNKQRLKKRLHEDTLLN